MSYMHRKNFPFEDLKWEEIQEEYVYYRDGELRIIFHTKDAAETYFLKAIHNHPESEHELIQTVPTKKVLRKYLK